MAERREPGELELLLHGINQPVVCAKCADDVAAGRAVEASIAEHQRLEVGFTEFGIQVWCRRHDANIVHVDFGGQRFRADFRCLESKPEGMH
ncbi:MAG: hypothetical protein V2J24_10120 [Pseudomonadales bacterium]|jgi:hypothetical protein|nr:hypothetical protein [Pseudomonadales bacterium]